MATGDNRSVTIHLLLGFLGVSALVIATHAEAHASPTVNAGIRAGIERERTTSRARL